MPKSKLLNFKPYKSFLYIFKHSKKSCLSGHSPPSTEVIAPLQNKVKPSTDSTRVIVLPSKTAPTIAPRLSPLLSTKPRPPTLQSQWKVRPWLHPLKRLCQRQAPSAYSGRRLSQKLWQIQIKWQLQPFPMMVKWRFSMTILAVMTRWRLPLLLLAPLLTKPASLPPRKRKKW